MLNGPLGAVWVVIQILLGYNLVLPLALYLAYRLKGRPKAGGNEQDKNEPDYAIIITAYEQTDTLHGVVDSILALNYYNFLVYIVADKCDISSLHFADKRIIVLRPEETLASNTRSHFYAIKRFQRQHARLTIIDSDNLVDPQYLIELNKLFAAGFSAVQGLRAAKNLDTTYSRLDAARDMYYHFFDGSVLFRLGSSATLAGSGMAFTTALYRLCLEHQDITGAGFDKILQKEIVSRGYRIAFAEKAIVYDEKTSRSDQLVKQRARWINTWFRYFKFGFAIIGNGIKKASWNQLLFGIILLRPPLFLFLIASFFCMILDILFLPAQAMWWLAGFICFIVGFLLAIAHSKPDKRIIWSLVSIPKFVFFQVLSLVKVRKANKHSVATQHYHSSSIKELKKDA